MSKLLVEISLNPQSRVEIRSLDGLPAEVVTQLIQAMAMYFGVVHGVSASSLLMAAHGLDRPEPEVPRGVILPAGHG